MGLPVPMSRSVATLTVVVVLVLLAGCGKGPYRFADIDAFVTRLDPYSMGEVTLDEKTGSEAPMNNPGRHMEVLIVGSDASIARRFKSELKSAGCKRWFLGACSVRTGSTEFGARPTYVPAGSQLPSGTEVPPGSTGVYLSMGY